MTTAQIAGLLASTVLPLVVGLVTKGSTPAVVKSLLLLALTAGITAAAAVASGADIKSSCVTGALSYATAVATHYGVLKPTGAADAVQAVGIKDAAHIDDSFDPGVPDELADVVATLETTEEGTDVESEPTEAAE